MAYENYTTSQLKSMFESLNSELEGMKMADVENMPQYTEAMCIMNEVYARGESVY